MSADDRTVTITGEEVRIARRSVLGYAKEHLRLAPEGLDEIAELDAADLVNLNSAVDHASRASELLDVLGWEAGERGEDIALDSEKRGMLAYALEVGGPAAEARAVSAGSLTEAELLGLRRGREELEAKLKGSR